MALTQKQQVEEFKKCSRTPEYFISKHIKVVHPIRGLVPFNLYGFQKRILSDLQEHRFNILRKFRQAGCTTIASGWALHLTVFSSHKTVVILSKGDAEAVEVLDRIKLMYDELPNFLKPKVVTKNAHTLTFENGSVIKSRPSGKQAGRGLSASLLIIDEAAFIEHIDTIWAAAYPTISTGGRAFVLSTVNGVGNWYHETYTAAVDGRNSFNAIDIRWQEHPEYHYTEGYEEMYKEMTKKGIDIHEWEDRTRANISLKKWLQEYECSFLGTGDTYIEGEVLKEVAQNTSEDYFTRYRNRMRVWYDPEPHYTYLICCDSALGRGGDYTGFHVLNLYNGEQVAEFYSNKTPINELAEIINEVGLLYNTAYIVPERNTIGNNLLDWLWNHYEYENIWFDEKDNMGIQIMSSNRDSILAEMEEAVRTNLVKLNSSRVIDELYTFVIKDNGKAEAETSYHDDLVMALAIGVHVYKKLMDSTPLEYITRVNKDDTPLSPSQMHQTQIRTMGGELEIEDYKWLIE